MYQMYKYSIVPNRRWHSSGEKINRIFTQSLSLIWCTIFTFLSIFTKIFSENDFQKNLFIFLLWEKTQIFLLGFPMYLKSGVTEQVIVIHGNHPKLYPLLVRRTGLENAGEDLDRKMKRWMHSVGRKIKMVHIVNTLMKIL